ncbi:hypothetical protein Droror1_Dr00024914 [Drosera rotundifolia]
MTLEGQLPPHSRSMLRRYIGREISAHNMISAHTIQVIQPKFRETLDCSSHTDFLAAVLPAIIQIHPPQSIILSLRTSLPQSSLPKSSQSLESLGLKCSDSVFDSCMLQQ